MTRTLQTVAVLIYWPWLTLRACVQVASRVALVVTRQVLEIWQ